MPSRPVVIGILLAWVAVLATVGYRELAPRYFADAPPVPEFVLVDELSQATVNWGIYRPRKNDTDEKIGSMSSRTEYVKEDDSFRLVNGYRGVRLRAGATELSVPLASVTVRVSRDGRLLEQTAHGSADLELGGGKLSATADVKAVVRDGKLHGTATLTAPGFLDKPLTAELEPVPVPDGQTLNPLMPTDRLRGVVPGHKWTVRHVDPLRDAVAELISKAFQQALAGAGRGEVGAVKLPSSPELLAEVLTTPQDLPRRGGPVTCWVIEYRSEKPPIFARTWVRRDDGRVLRQEATVYGETMRFEREE